MRIFGPTIYELREPAAEQERTRRLAELAEEITLTRRKLIHAFREEVRQHEADFEAQWLHGERERLEVALGNLEREHREVLEV